MKIITQIAELRATVQEMRGHGKSVGFVPTMGYLHAGHQALMRQAKAEQGAVVASIFVNPLQFGPSEDYAVYPRDLERDSQLAETAGVDILFVPALTEMYPSGLENMLTAVEVSKLTTVLCGASRPTHFRGVTTVVAKLFNIVQPDAAYFGQKDAQQVIVIQQMVKDLNMDINIVVVPIVREPDGLAMSSRNVFLSSDERQAALVLSRALQTAEQLLQAGERQSKAIVSAMQALIAAEPLAVIDYVEIRDRVTLEAVALVDKQVLVALALKIGKTRLIDNIMWGEL